MRTNKI